MTSSKDIEREAEESRAQLSSTLEQLRERLTPGQLVDDMLQGSGAGARAFAGNLGRTVRDNPVPSLLIGAGVLMMMTGVPSLGVGSSSSGRGMRSYADDGRDETRWRHRDEDRDPWSSGDDESLTERAGEMASQARDTVGSAASGAVAGVRSAVRTVQDTASGLADSVTGAFHSASDTAGDMRERGSAWADQARNVAGDVTGHVSDTMHSVSETMRTATGRTMDMGREVQDRMSRMMEEQPLVMGAVGLFVGAAIGALLPSTRVENRMMGESADRLKDTATGYAAEQFEHAQEVAGEVVDRVREEAQAQGLSVEAAKQKAREAAGEIGEKVQAVAGKAKEVVAGEAGQAAAPGQGQADKGPAGGQLRPGMGRGEAGTRSPSDPLVTRPPGGPAMAGEGGPAPRGPSPAAAQPSVVTPPPTGPGSSAGQASTGAGAARTKGGTPV